ncbi:DNA-binding domain-containing protein [Lysobacter niastensis]|uniref:DNA-binding domain-containing protein n=1 Tax=Lysobacter niastensis TaxID=380629 RepID=A0ABS0B5R0_9GAMM|nr:putative DNA-binding domain-containing protein [Lysobacter niastensis]MBF6024235.1 putative DNA-binding domain-containing protein [Lysobacter niastensis]
MRAPEAPSRLREQQLSLTRHLRDPQGQPAPAGIEERRLAVYRDLLFNNVENLLSGNFPVISRLLGESRWKTLVREFFRDHRCQTPLFPELPREFLRFLESREPNDPPFLLELAHYEWVELALQIAETDGPAYDPQGDLLDGVPVLSPLAWYLAYRWPVHQIGPDHQPDTPPPAPTLLLLRRESDGTVRFSTLSPLAFRLLQRLGEASGLSGREQLQALALEAGDANVTAFLEQGQLLLEQMHATGVVLGIETR